MRLVPVSFPSRSPAATHKDKYSISISFPPLRSFFVFLFSPVEVHGKERARSVRVAGLSLWFSTGRRQRRVLDIVKKVLRVDFSKPLSYGVQRLGHGVVPTSLEPAACGISSSEPILDSRSEVNYRNRSCAEKTP